MEHDPKELRRAAIGFGDSNVGNVYRAYADLIERHAKLLKHAEAMAGWIDANDGPFPDSIDALVNFRADFPKG